MQVSCTNSWICWTSLVVRVSSDGAPNRAVSAAEKPVTWWNIAERRSRPKPIPAREPKYTAPMAHTTCSPVTASITPPSSTMVPVSPLATPSSMIAALTVGRYSEARVLIIWSTATAASSQRYGRTYCRSSARSISLLSHTDLSSLRAGPMPISAAEMAGQRVSQVDLGWLPLQCAL